MGRANVDTRYADGNCQCKPSCYALSDGLHSRAAAAETDGGIVDVNCGGIGTKAGGVVVDAPSAVAVEVACLHVGKVQDLDAVLPESDVSVSLSRAFIECLDLKPPAFRNVFDGLAIRVPGVFVVEIEIHFSVGTIAHIQSYERIVGLSALGFPLENVPPRGITVWNVTFREVEPDAVIEFRILFRLQPAEQACATGGKLPIVQSIDKEPGGVKTAMGRPNRIYASCGEAAVEDASTCVRSAQYIGNAPLREITGFHIGRP